jgi:hypothetical protein
VKTRCFSLAHGFGFKHHPILCFRRQTFVEQWSQHKGDTVGLKSDDMDCRRQTVSDMPKIQSTHDFKGDLWNRPAIDVDTVLSIYVPLHFKSVFSKVRKSLSNEYLHLQTRCAGSGFCGSPCGLRVRAPCAGSVFVSPCAGSVSCLRVRAPCTGSASCLRVRAPCAGSVCGLRVRAPCRVSVCGLRVRVPCAGSVSCLRVVSPCRVSVRGLRVRVPCSGSVFGLRVRAPCRVSVCGLRVRVPCRVSVSCLRARAPCSGSVRGFHVPEDSVLVQTRCT